MSLGAFRLELNRGLLLGTRALGVAFAAGTPTVPMLWAESGMSMGQFYLLEIIFAVALVVLEVVTGRLADRRGKVFTMKLGFAALSVGSLVYGLADSFADFVIGEILIALGLALNSGTDEAFLFQTNKTLGAEESHQRWWTYSIGSCFISMGIFAIVGTHVSAIDLSYPYLLTAGFEAIAFLMCFLMVEPPREEQSARHFELEALREAAAAVLVASPAIRWMALAPGLLAGINQTHVWMYPEYLKECSVSLEESGYIFAFFNLIAGISALALRKVRDDQEGMRVLFVLTLGLAASTIGLLSLVGAFAWLLIVPQQCARSVSGSLFSRSINEAIPDRVRATALSVRNAARMLLYVAVMVPWWLGVDHLGRNGMFSVNVALLTVGAIYFWVTRPQRFIA